MEGSWLPNWLDLLFWLGLVAMVGWGFFTGFIRQLVGLVALYAGLLLATEYNVLLATFLRSIAVDLSMDVARVVSFSLILALATGFLIWLWRGLFHDVNIVAWEVVGNFAGALVSLIFGLAVLTLAIMLLQYFFLLPQVRQPGIGHAIWNGTQEAQTLALWEVVSRGLGYVLSPFLPDALPPFLQITY